MCFTPRASSSVLFFAVFLTACGAETPALVKPQAPATASHPEATSASVIDIDEAAAACRSRGPWKLAASPGVLALSTADATAVGGGVTELLLEARNTGSAPLDITFQHGCKFFVTVTAADGEIVQPGPGGGICAGKMVAVSLPPGGVLRKRLPLTASRGDLVCSGGCHFEAEAALQPGAYHVEVDTPFLDLVADGRLRTRTASATLRVSP
jgi:hypothetical protein